MRKKPKEPCKWKLYKYEGLGTFYGTACGFQVFANEKQFQAMTKCKCGKSIVLGSVQIYKARLN